MDSKAGGRCGGARLPPTLARGLSERSDRLRGGFAAADGALHVAVPGGTLRDLPDRRRIIATRAAGTRQQLTASARPAAGPGSTSLPVIDLVDFPGRSRRGRSVVAVWCVGGQPLCRERVRRRLAPAVAGDGGEELLPAKGEGTQCLLGGDGRGPRDAAKQRDLAEAISPLQGWPGRASHAYRRRSVDDQVEVVAGLS